MVRILRTVRHWAADAVTISRIVLVIQWTRCESAGSAWAFPVMAGIVASDLLDSPIARRLGTARGGGAADRHRAQR